MNLELTYQTIAVIDGVKYGWEIAGKFILPQTLQGFAIANINAYAGDPGYQETLKMVLEDFASLPLEEPLVRKLHERILRHSQIDLYKKGQYNFNQGAASASVMGMFMGKQAVPPAQQEMKNAVQKYQDSSRLEHPLIKIAGFIQTFLTLSPFRDENGKVCDVLIVLLMLQQGYEFVKWAPLDFLKDTPFDLDRFLNSVKNQALLSIEIMNRDTIEHLLSPKQTKLWEWACLNKAQTFSRKDAVEALGFPERTVEEIIKKLTIMKKLIRIGQGKATCYKVV